MSKLKPCHSMMRELIEEEIHARGWSDPEFIISQLANTSQDNASRLLLFQTRLTGVECWMLNKTFGLSEGFMERLQKRFETHYPEEQS